MRNVGRLRIVNHGTLEDPRYVVLGYINPEGLELLGVSRLEDKEAALFDIRDIMGQADIVYKGLTTQGYGLNLNEVWLSAPATFATEEELARLRANGIL